MTTWMWLTEPLPLDAANTRRWADQSQADFLNDPVDLEAWFDVVRARLPRHHLELPGSFDRHDLNAFRELRDLLIDIFEPLSQGRAAPAVALRRLGHICLSHPVIRVVDESGPAWVAPEGQRPQDHLVGLVAAEGVSLITAAAGRIAICDAPSCHWLYLQGRPNQRWCHPDCGNRARVRRYHRLHLRAEAHVAGQESAHVD